MGLYNYLMPARFSQKGFSHLAVLILLFLGVALGVYLVSQRTNIFPQAFERKSFRERFNRPSANTPSTTGVGYQQKTLKYTTPEGKQKEFVYSIWYPSTSAVKAYEFPFVSANVALEGQVKKQSPYPLLIFTHGFLGCSTTTVYITEYIASQGYIVAAPNHEDGSVLCSVTEERNKLSDILRNRSNEGVLTMGNRPYDTKATLDEMLKLNSDSSSPFYRTIDTNKLAVFGHSLGGATAIFNAGGGVPQAKDSRFKAVISYDAASVKDQTSADQITNVDIPIMYQTTSKNENNPKSYEYNKKPKFLAVVANSNHLSFDDTVCKAQKTTEKCRSDNPQAKVVVKYTKAFFDYYLKNDASAKQILENKDSSLSDYKFSF